MKSTTVYFCAECGNEFAKWSGQCPACKAWNTMTEAPRGQEPAASGPSRRGAPPSQTAASQPRLLEEVSLAGEERFSTGLGELDRVLGGGAVRGSLTLFGGEPGVG